MSALTLRCPHDRAKHVITSAFETTGIDEWHDEGTRLVAAPMVPGGSDEYIIVELPDPHHSGVTPAAADDEVSITIRATDSLHSRQFLHELEKLNGSEIAVDASVEPSVELPPTTSVSTAQPTNEYDSRETTSLLRILLVAMVMLGICLTFLTMGAAMT